MRALLAVLLLGATSARAETGLELPVDMLKIRDPFKRPALMMDAGVPRSELEAIPVEQFKMLGMITGPDRIKAMIAGPSGKTFFVSMKTKIGVRQGVVTRITPTEVQVHEKIVNVLGQEEAVETEIRLQSGSSKKGEGP